MRLMIVVAGLAAVTSAVCYAVRRVQERPTVIAPRMR